MRTRTELTQAAVHIKEKFFACGMEVLRPVNYMIQDTYPVAKRDPRSKEHDAFQADEFDKAMRRARFALYEQRNVVQDRWLPRYDITRTSSFHPTDDWEELRSCLVDNCLDRLAERLITLSPILVAKAYVEGVQESILRVVDKEKQNLTDYLRSFYVVRKKGIPTIEEDYQ